MIKKKALFLFSTVDGQTFAIISKIALYIAEHVEDIEYEVYDLSKLPEINLTSYSSVLVGTAIRYKKFDKLFLNFIDQHYEQLNRMKSAFFCTSLSARKSGKDTPETNSYTKNFLAKTSWKPDLVEVFAGALRYPKYAWYDKLMIKFIMRLNGEKQDLSKEYNYTNWQKVEGFANQFIKLVHES